MTGQGISQIVVYAIVLVALGYPLGIYMARVYGTLGAPSLLRGIESGFYRLVRTDPTKEQDWKSYGKTVVIFSILFSGVLYAIQRLQGHLFLNPDKLKGVPAHISLNTAASFVTNTNWQYYGGEYTMSYLSQMAGLAVQNFVSAAVGMAVLAAVVRGLARRSRHELGNFWVDLYRSLVYILLPLCLILATILISQGVVQTFHGHATATTLEGAQQTIARGPAASQIAMKQLGTNGGGFYNSNSAVPFENSNGFTNFLEMLSILLIPAAQVFMFGRMVLARRHAWMVFAAMFAMFAIGVGVVLPSEQHGSQVLRNSGVNITQGNGQSGGNMADKEVRDGIANTSLWAVATTDASAASARASTGCSSISSSPSSSPD
jgi:K+-transporting ATPase ATPase A chain